MDVRTKKSGHKYETIKGQLQTDIEVRARAGRVCRIFYMNRVMR